MSSSVTDTQAWRDKLLSTIDSFDFNAVLQSRWVQQTPLWLNIFMVILLAYALAEFTWRVLTPASTYSISTQQIASQTQQRQSARLNTVGDMHLFGIAQSNKVQQLDIKKTQLRLALHGVFASTDPAQAVAIIAEGKTDAGRAYKIGDNVPGGAVVHEVKANEVILRRNGNLESLPLPRDRLPDSAFKQPAKTVATVRNVQANQKLRKLRDTFVKSPEKFWQNIRIEPAFDAASGKVKGYTIRHNDPAIMQAMGIQPGDVVTGVNGAPLTDPTVAYGLIEQMKSGNEFSLTVDRNGLTQTINVNMQ